MADMSHVNETRLYHVMVPICIAMKGVRVVKMKAVQRRLAEVGPPLPLATGTAVFLA
ncbi:hypothetical protein [Antarctobacter jejuensis]|uniref:hypothetical protein n=1 Tax=Antarctobacter jejuensis TaxID=1439938 RepID=UPI003FD0F729